MTIADIGYGASFAIESPTPGTYVKVAEVFSIAISGFSRDAIDATHLESPDGYREFIPGMRDAGEITIGLNWAASVTDAVLAVFNTDLKKFRITAPDGKKMDFDGFCTSYAQPELSTDRMTATAVFKITGKPTAWTV